jgi:AAA+ ATPase superfamily predicted ATPase
MFMNRESELTHLEEEYSKDTPRFIVLYGRRRIGKTALIEEFGKNKKDFIYFLADQQTETQQIESFKQQIYVYTHDDFLLKTRFDNWDQFFSYLTKILPADKRFIIAIDEITYLIKSTPAFLSILQKYWDTFFSKTKIFLIVSGSLVGMMVREVLNYDSPMYGRRTSQIHLKAFNFKNASKMMKNIGIEEQIEFYSITGGVAKYLLLIEEKSIEEFIRKKITRYLDVLHEIGLVMRQVPITEDPLKFRKGVYAIEDNFLNFWFRFVLPNRSRIELRDIKDLLKNILDSLPDYASEAFEHIGSEFLQEMSRSGKLPATFTHWGKWWDRLNEIDIVAKNDDTLDILICECKWKKRKADADAIKHLLDTAPYVKWFNENRKEHFAFISKAGFTGKAVRIADENGVLLFDLKDMEKYYSLL